MLDDFNFHLAQPFLSQQKYFIEDFMQVHRLFFSGRGLVETLQIFEQVLDAVAFLDRKVHEVLVFSAQHGRFLNFFKNVADAVDRIVQFVCDGRAQFAQGRQFFGMHEPVMIAGEVVLRLQP